MSPISPPAPPPAPPVWWRAVEFAIAAHAGMLQPDGETPYVAHPLRVAIIATVDFGCDDPEVATIALLHDVVEKTTVTAAEVERQFGATVANAVVVLTKPPNADDDAYWNALEGSAWRVRLVKLADVCENLLDGSGPLPQRVEKLRKALALAFGTEPPIRKARERLIYLLDDFAVVKSSHLLVSSTNSP